MVRREFAGELDRLRRVRHRRMIVLRKAALLDGRHSLSPHSASGSLKQRAAAAAAAAAVASASAAEEAAASAIAAEKASQAAAALMASTDFASGRVFPRGKHAFGSGIGGHSLSCPRSPRERGNSGSVSLTKFLAQQESHLAPSTYSRASAVPKEVPGVDVPALLGDLLACGSLSSSPRPPPWPQEQPGLSDLEAVRGWLASALPAAEVRSVHRVECRAATAAAYASVSRTLGPERLLWHGTAWDAVPNITQNGFNRAYAGRHGTKLGKGSYFAEEASYALRFSGPRSHSRAVFLAGVLPGSFCRGEEGLVEPPLVAASGARYDSTVDDPERPRVFCVFRDFQALPLYVAEVVPPQGSSPRV